jgi:hypothetical protein
LHPGEVFGGYHADLAEEPFGAHRAQLGEGGVVGFISVGEALVERAVLLLRSDWENPRHLVVQFAQDHGGSLERRMLAVDLDTDGHSDCDQKLNPSWGYDRIVGALANLRCKVSDQTDGNDVGLLLLGERLDDVPDDRFGLRAGSTSGWT